MPLHVTFHPTDPSLSPTARGIHQAGLPVLGAKTGNSAALTVDSEAHTSAVGDPCLARIVATEACRVEVGVDATANGSNSEYWPEGHVDVRYVPAGGRVSVIAAA